MSARGRRRTGAPAGQTLTPFDPAGLARIRDPRLSTWLDDDVDAAIDWARACRAAWPPSHDFSLMPAPPVLHFVTAEAARRRCRALREWFDAEVAETGRSPLTMLASYRLPPGEFDALNHARQSARLSGTAAPDQSSAGVAFDVDIDIPAE